MVQCSPSTSFYLCPLFLKLLIREDCRGGRVLFWHTVANRSFKNCPWRFAPFKDLFLAIKQFALSLTLPAHIQSFSWTFCQEWVINEWTALPQGFTPSTWLAVKPAVPLVAVKEFVSGVGGGDWLAQGQTNLFQDFAIMYNVGLYHALFAFVLIVVLCVLYRTSILAARN